MFLDNFKEPLRLTNHGIRLPEFTMEDDDRKTYQIQDGATNYDILTSLARVGYKTKLDKGLIPKNLATVYGERFKKELETLKRTNFVDYILVVWDVMAFARKNNLAIGRGRGCLTGDSQVYTTNGYKNLRDVKKGDIIRNSLGDLDTVVNTFEYDCSESLLEFKTSSPTFSKQALTRDHKVLVLKNPFSKYTKKSKGETWLDSKKIRNEGLDKFFDNSNLEWVRADSIQVGDYVVRSCKSLDSQDIESIDLSVFSEHYDDESVSYVRGYNESSPLRIRTLAKEIGVCRSTLKKYLSGDFYKKTNGLEKVSKYFEDHSLNTEQLSDRTKVTKIQRYLSVDEDFLFLLGYFIGDGWVWGSRVGLAFHSEDNQAELNKIEIYLSKIGLDYHLNYHKSKKLIQLSINSPIVANLLKSLVPSYAVNKLIPQFALDLPLEKKKSLLKGLIASDGSVKDRRISYDSININLCHQVRHLLEELGDCASLYMRNPKERNRASFKVRTLKTSESLHSYNNNTYVFSRVKKISEVENPSKKVYDLEIKNHPSYNTDKFIVHNSAAGSLINYLTGITDVDPIKYGLFFERFISETRAKTNVVDGVTYLVGSMPDIDMDFGDEDRDKVIQYVSDKYKGKFVKLSTTGTLTTKILTKELGKVNGYSEDYMNTISDCIPMVFGKVYSPEKCYEESEDYKIFADQNPHLYEMSKVLHECINHTGSHASAYLISFDPLEKFMPVQLGSDGEKISSYDMYEAQNLAVKLDLLGVQSINLIYSVAKAVGLDLDLIDVESWDNIYKFLQKLEFSYGLFQISGHTAVKALNKIKPKTLEHLSGVLAIARPGALKFVDEYADYTNNGTVPKTFPLFEEILGETGGVCLFQETLMALFVKLGFSLEDANTLRDIIGKKKTEKIREWEPKIYEKALENGVPKEAAEFVWSLALASADYSFNKCLSPDTLVQTRRGRVPIRECKPGDEVLGYDTGTKSSKFSTVLDVITGEREIWEVSLENGKTIQCSMEHKILCEDLKMRPLKEILELGLGVVCE